MTDRKPQGMPVHNWIDRLIQDAQERGEFDNLPGAGKPLPGIDKPLDEDWWIRQKLRSEDLPLDDLLPPALQLRREVANLPETVRHLRGENEVRAAVKDVNMRVAAWIRAPSDPVLPVSPADPGVIVEGWRAAREADRRTTLGAIEAVPHRPGPTDSSPAEPGSTSDNPARAGSQRERGSRRRRRWWWFGRR